jgi:DnaJ-class molecular chaperone
VSSPVASEETDSEDLGGASHEPRECMPCRGSGQVISNLGDAPSKVTCPWCAGGGVRVAGTDAQARWPREQAAADSGGDGPAATDEAGAAEAPPPAA